MSARTILVADEDTDTRIILRTVLERHRFVVIEGATADTAFEQATTLDFDLVILNYPMCDAEGRTLVSRLRAEPATRHVPILNLTSRVVPQFLRAAADEGVSLTLPKPVEIETIITTVSDLLTEHRAAVS